MIIGWSIRFVLPHGASELPGDDAGRLREKHRFALSMVTG
jgi:hypothetical protein